MGCGERFHGGWHRAFQISFQMETPNDLNHLGKCDVVIAPRQAHMSGADASQPDQLAFPQFPRIAVPRELHRFHPCRRQTGGGQHQQCGANHELLRLRTR